MTSRLRVVLLGVCGDAKNDSVVDSADLAAIRAFVSDPNGAALSAEGAARCSVIGSDADCDMRDAVVLARLLAVPTLAPGIVPVCAAAP